MISKKYLQIAILPVLLILILVMRVPIVHAQASSTQENTTKLSEAAGSPVILSSDTLFFVRVGLGPYTSEQRAKSITDRLKRLEKDPLFRIESISISDDELGTNILAGEVIIATVTDADTKAVGLNRQELAKMYAQKIQKTMERVRTQHSLKTILLGLLFTLISIAVLVIIFKMFQRVFPKVISKLNSWRGTRIKTLKIQTLELLSSDQITDLLIGLVKIIRVLAILLVLYFFIPLVLSFFPWTRGFGGVIIGYILSPLNVIWKSFVAYLPKAFFIVLIVIVTRYVLKFIRLIFNQVARGKIVLPRFYQDWADPTYKIVRFLIIAFVIVVIFPYLPGSDAPAFKGVSIFLGILFSLGSTSIVANIIAGVILTYMRPFQKGDRVKIADTIGDVEKKSLLGTHIRTIKNEDITIPNAMVLGSHIINFSSSKRDPGLILHTTVTIGYDAPWRTVHQLLISAAKSTAGILNQPEPFVLQTSLDDSYVSYQINAYTNEPNRMAEIYSVLHQNIQDKFNEAKVEIMSPHYGAVRDGNQTTIPADYLPQEYQAPTFRISKVNDEESDKLK